MSFWDDVNGIVVGPQSTQIMSTPGIRQLMSMSRMVDAHTFGLLSYYDYPIYTAPLEGTNNKIITL